jgi:hypothetical protein
MTFFVILLYEDSGLRPRGCVNRSIIRCVNRTCSKALRFSSDPMGSRDAVRA